MVFPPLIATPKRFCSDYMLGLMLTRGVSGNTENPKTYLSWTRELYNPYIAREPAQNYMLTFTCDLMHLDPVTALLVCCFTDY